MRLNDLYTPCLVLNETRLKRNIATMNARIHGKGVRLRPHMKTAKSIDIARLVLEENFGGITVSTLREAAYFGSHGIRDMVYAVCITPQKLEPAALLHRRYGPLAIITDHPEMVRAIGDAGKRFGCRFPVMIEIDSGEARTGVDPRDEAFLAIARALHESDGASLEGVLTHAGHSYDCRDRDALIRVAECERRIAVDAANRLRAMGLPCPRVSIGSTPTAAHVRDLEGVTEMRPGVYMFGDLFQAEIGSCRMEDIALSVLATVISHRPERNRFVIDAGALALSKDRSTAKTENDAGYGLVCDESGRPIEPRMTVTAVHQEHGEVTGPDTIDFARFPIGCRLRVLPNHACITAAMHDRYHVVAEDAGEVTAVWHRTNGWAVESEA